MKKIAVGALGEFWYGDYKEPFVQLEGGVPGHPQGVVLKDDDGKLMCAWCGKTFHGLGRHIGHAHGMRASDYKREVGLLQKSALVSERTRLVASRHLLRRRAHGEMQPAPHGKRPTNIASYRRTPEHLNKTGRCYEQVRTVAQALAANGQLSQRQLNKVGIGRLTVDRYWGSFDALARDVGGGRRGHGRYTDAELIRLIQSIARDLGRSPVMSDVRRFGLPDGAIIHHFGTWNAALIQAGLPQHLPMALDGEDAIQILVAFAHIGQVTKTATATGRGKETVSRVLGTYGITLPSGNAPHTMRSAMQERAAEVARRLAGTDEQVA